MADKWAICHVAVRDFLSLWGLAQMAADGGNFCIVADDPPCLMGVRICFRHDSLGLTTKRTKSTKKSIAQMGCEVASIWSQK